MKTKNQNRDDSSLRHIHWVSAGLGFLLGVNVWLIGLPDRMELVSTAGHGEFLNACCVDAIKIIPPAIIVFLLLVWKTNSFLQYARRSRRRRQDRWRKKSKRSESNCPPELELGETASAKKVDFAHRLEDYKQNVTPGPESDLPTRAPFWLAPDVGLERKGPRPLWTLRLLLRRIHTYLKR